MKIHRLSPQEALSSLHSCAEGLPSAEATRRLGEFGLNRVQRLEGESLLRRFLLGFTHLFALILWLAAGLAFFAGTQDRESGMTTLGIAIIGVILLNGLFSFWQEFRAEQSLSALQRLLPHQVKVKRAGIVCAVPVGELVPGDVVLLDAGDEVPADCRVIEAFGLRVNNATITGEALPKARNRLPCEEDDLLHARNVLLAGTSVVSGEAQALVFATGMHTEFGKIAHLTQQTRDALSPLQREIVRLSRFIAALALVLGGLFFVLSHALGLPTWHSLLFAVGIIVANVPEGLLPTVTLALAMASQRMAKRNALVRHLPSVETLGSATVICTDKTGTLTQNRMAVRRLFLGGESHDSTDLASRPELALHYRSLFDTAFLCHTLRETTCNGRQELLGDPMEVALVALARQVVQDLQPLPHTDEVPFDSDRKRLSTLHRLPGGLVLHTKGALETVLPLCSQVRIGRELRSLDGEWKERLLQVQDDLAGRGLRVLAFASRNVPENYEHDRLESELTLDGLVGLEDPPRPEVPEAIRRCREAGIKVIMVTGDHPQTARAVARQIGLIQTEGVVVVTGDQLRRMSNTQLQLTLDASEILFARVGADQKLRIVQALKAKNQIVAVTGDGVNDAPALRQADIGIAMGRVGTEVAREAADMVLLDDNFASIVSAVEEGRAVYANIRKFLTYILTSNVPELVPYLAFVLFRVPLALTVVQILAVDLGTDVVPALGLGAEKPDPDTMTRPPRRRDEPLLNAPLLLRAYGFLGMLEALAAMAAFFFVLLLGGWYPGETLGWRDPLYLQATTACLGAIIVSQIVNVFLCRSDKQSICSVTRRSNPLILYGIAAEILLILLITYTGVGNALFGTSPIGVEMWLFIVPFAALMLALEELRKWLIRRDRQPRPPQPDIHLAEATLHDNRTLVLTGDHGPTF